MAKRLIEQSQISKTLSGRAGLIAALAVTTILAAGHNMGSIQVHASEPVSTSQFDRGYADLAERILPSVVNVSVERDVRPESAESDPRMERFFERFFGPEFEMPERRQNQQPARNAGSGFVIDNQGLIVTNAHVVKGADRITVAMQDGKKLDATLKGIDEKTDLALLEVEDTAGLKAVQFADSDVVRVGDKVLAIGNPFGLGGTVTSGIVSATGRELGSGPYDDFLQLDAAINRGNSGGPTFNLDGEVIGVNTLIFSPSGGNVGIGFAISSNLAQSVIADLADDGVIERGWLGVSIQPLNDNLAAALDLGEAEGALVSSVVEGSPADLAGIEEGDVILRFGERRIDKPSTLSKAVAGQDPGSLGEIAVWRDGAEVMLDVELGILDDRNLVVATAPVDEAVPSGLGMRIVPMDDEDRARAGLEDGREGVAVASVDPEGAAAMQDIREGDVILSVDNNPVATPSDVADAVEAARSQGRDAVAMLIARERGQFFMALSLAAS